MTHPIPKPKKVYQSYAAVCFCGKISRGHSEKAAITNYERHYLVEHVD